MPSDIIKNCDNLRLKKVFRRPTSFQTTFDSTDFLFFPPRAKPAPIPKKAMVAGSELDL
jgi:hypothetical protein